VPPAPYDTLYAVGRRPKAHGPELLELEDLTPEEVALEMGAYDGAITYLDREVDRLLTELARRGVLDNTIAIVTSDHGEHWGDHNRLSHGNSMYRQLLQVPLVIRYPRRVPRGTLVPAPVSLRDLPNTILDLAGVASDARFPGGSLTAHLGAAPPAGQAPIIAGGSEAGWKDGLSVVASGLHYVRLARGREEIYDLDADPLDTLDLAATPRGRAALPQMRAILESVLGPPPGARPADPEH
jgi:arylsulfatase A-like enzyme